MIQPMFHKHILDSKDSDHGNITTQYFASLYVTVGADQTYKFEWIYRATNNTCDNILDQKDNITIK